MSDAVIDILGPDLQVVVANYLATEGKDSPFFPVKLPRGCAIRLKAVRRPVDEIQALEKKVAQLEAMLTLRDREINFIRADAAEQRLVRDLERASDRTKHAQRSFHNAQRHYDETYKA